MKSAALAFADGVGILWVRTRRDLLSNLPVGYQFSAFTTVATPRERVRFIGSLETPPIIIVLPPLTLIGKVLPV